MARRLLAIAASTGRVGYVFFIGKRLTDWRVSEKAAKSSEQAVSECQKWINELQPDVVVTEKSCRRSKKDGRTLEINAALTRTAEHNYLLDVSVKRDPELPNKYDEAKAQAERFPALSAWVPKKRRFFDNEPRNIVLFEALSLAEVILGRGNFDCAKTAQ